VIHTDSEKALDKVPRNRLIDKLVSYGIDEALVKAQCYGQFGKLKDWSQKLLSSVRRTELKEPEITKSSSAI